MAFILTVFAAVCINMIGMLAIFVITGLTGKFSMGQASFMAIGAYAAGMIALSFKLPMFVGILAAIFIGLLFAFLVGLPAVKLRNDYVALITFGFGEAIVAILNNFASITGGAMGLSGIPKNTTPLLAFLALVFSIYIVYSFKKSKYGRQCLALKSDELAAAAMGINTNKIKLIAFMLGGALTAFAGAIYVYFTTYVEPMGFGWLKSADWIIIVFVGGLNSLTGAVVSGLFLGSLPELLRFASIWRILIYCVIVLLIVNFRPQGIFGTYEFSFTETLKWLKRVLLSQTAAKIDAKATHEEDR
jgi:branched-chain amino acid transport system permease protein